MYRGPNDPQWWPDQQHRSASLSLEQRLRRLRFVGLAIVAATILMIGAVSVLHTPSPEGQSSTLSTADATATVTASATPKGPHIISGPYIGGTEDAFTAVYGSPTVQYNIPTYSFTQPDGTQVYIKLYTFSAGTDGALRAQLFSVYSSKDGVWTPEANYEAARVVFPTDAHFVKDVSDPQVGVLHVWQSANLGLTFPPSAWDDANGGPRWPAGTFAVACYTGQQMCSFATGV